MNTLQAFVELAKLHPSKQNRRACLFAKSLMFMISLSATIAMLYIIYKQVFY